MTRSVILSATVPSPELRATEVHRKGLCELYDVPCGVALGTVHCRPVEGSSWMWRLRTGKFRFLFEKPDAVWTRAEIYAGRTGDSRDRTIIGRETVSDSGEPELTLKCLIT